MVHHGVGIVYWVARVAGLFVRFFGGGMQSDNHIHDCVSQMCFYLLLFFYSVINIIKYAESKVHVNAFFQVQVHKNTAVTVYRVLYITRIPV